MTLLLILIFGILSLFIPLILQQGENLSLLDVNALETKITRLFEEISSYFNWNNANWKAWLLEKDWMNTLNLTAVPEFLNALLGWVSGFTIALFSILFISFFFLKDAQLLERAVLVFFLLKTINASPNHLKKSKTYSRAISWAYYCKSAFYLYCIASYWSSSGSKMLSSSPSYVRC